MALLLAFTAPAARADSRIGGGEGNLAGGLEAIAGVASSAKEGGDVYIVDKSLNQRVSQFSPAGGFERAFGWGIVPGAAAGIGNLTAGSRSVTNVTTTLGAFGRGGSLDGFITGAGIAPGTFIVGVNQSEIQLSKPVESGHSGSGVALTVSAGPGNVPTNEVQRLTIRATAGEFKLSFTSPNPGSETKTTAALSFDASAAQVQSALEALSNLGPGSVAVSGGPGDEEGSSPYLVEFKGRYADVNVHPLTTSNISLSGGKPSPVAAVATTHEGAGALETCTAICSGESFEEGGEVGQGSAPAQWRYPEAIAVDNSCAEQEPPLTGAACETFDPSYGDIYVVDQRNFRVEKYSPSGEFLLMFGGGVDKGPHHPGDVCTEDYLAEGDECGAGEGGTGPSHFYGTGFPNWSTEGEASIAVGPGGTVYVGDYDRIQEFEPEGAFTGELTLGDSEAQFVTALAVDVSGDIFERSATYIGELTSQVPGVREYGPAPGHAFLRTFDAEEPTSEPTHIALDEAGDLIVSDYNRGPAPPNSCTFTSGSSTCPEETFRAFKPSGLLYAIFTSDQVKVNSRNGQFSNPGGIAVDSAAGTLFASSYFPEGVHIAAVTLPEPGPPSVTGMHVTDLEPTTATLHGVVNPEQFDTHARFQWITESACKANETAGHECFLGAEEKPPATGEDLGSVSQEDPVQAAISDLTPGTAYRWRVLAESECEPVANPGHICKTKPEAEFETLPPVSVRDFTTQTVAPEEVTIKFELNNNNSLQQGHYVLHLCSDSGCATPIAEKQGTLPAGAGAFEPKQATFTGLQPNTTYHYRLFLENAYGHEETAPAEFTTEETLAEQDAREGCSNALRREEDNSLALPDCRAYEQVSPAYKAGYPSAASHWTAPSGERVLFISNGAFAGAVQNAATIATQYISRRTESGWSTRPAVANVAGPESIPMAAQNFTSGLDRWTFIVTPGLSSEIARTTNTSGTIYMGSEEGPYHPASPTVSLPPGAPPVNFESALGVEGQADDLSRLFVTTGSQLLPGDPRPGLAQPGFSAPLDRIYEVSGALGDNPQMRLIAEVPVALTDPTCQIDHEGDSDLTRFGARLTTSDGSTLIYALPIKRVGGAPCGEGSPNPFGLFALTGQSTPVQLNAESPTQCSSGHPCKGAPTTTPKFAGVSPDGRFAWFTTHQPLVDSDADTGEGAAANDLYLAKLTESGQLEELVQASAGDANPEHPSVGQGAGVQGVLDISSDGTHVAFVATGVLTTERNQFDQAAQGGADNLYVYSPVTGQISFVAQLCSAAGRSGAVEDRACPASIETGNDEKSDATLWSGRHSLQAQFTPDGRYLLLPSVGRLTPDDTDDARDIYRYDAQAGQLIRLSFGRNGNDGNGNDSSFNDTLPVGGVGQGHEAFAISSDSRRSISSDGSVVIFETAAPLASRDTNTGPHPGCGASSGGSGGAFTSFTGCDIYEWEEQGHGTCREAGGCVRLVSDGVYAFGAHVGVLGASGQDVTFFTPRGDVPADTDGLGDVYDAREGGGFPYVVPHEPPCASGSPEACHGPATESTLHPSCTTCEFEAPPPPTRIKCAKGRHRVIKHGQVRCVPNKHKRHRKHHRRAHRRARANRGGAK